MACNQTWWIKQIYKCNNDLNSWAINVLLIQKLQEHDLQMLHYSKHYSDSSVNKAPWSQASTVACDDENKTAAHCLRDPI